MTGFFIGGIDKQGPRNRAEPPKKMFLRKASSFQVDTVILYCSRRREFPSLQKKIEMNRKSYPNSGATRPSHTRPPPRPQAYQNRPVSYLKFPRDGIFRYFVVVLITPFNPSLSPPLPARRAPVQGVDPT